MKPALVKARVILLPVAIGALLLTTIALLQNLWISHAAITPRNFILPALVGSIAGLLIGLYHHKLNQREQQLKEILQGIQHSALYDQLTGLANHTLLTDRLRQAIFRARRKGDVLAIALLDLDRFKRINETMGHSMGNHLLLEITRRLTTVTRESDTLARLGGDEFVLLMSTISHPDDAALVAGKLLDVVAAPIILEGQEIFCSCSIGISLCPQDSDNEETILKNAEIAMYSAKNSGGNSYRFYSMQMNQQALERLSLEGYMVRGIEQGTFFLNYQPQVEIETGRIIGVEALIRWKHPFLGMISPTKLISLAEESGFIIPLGLWVLRTACEQAVAWRKAGLPPIKMAVNLSIRQFRQHDLIASITKILDETGLARHQLELELTESCFVERPDQALAMLRELKKLGVNLAIDDFGTGYSSLAHLKLLPIDLLKIALPFVQDVTTNKEDAAIVEAIITMAHTMGIKVIAEGVETTAQQQFLEWKKCNYAQGYLFARPMSGDDVAKLLGYGEKQIIKRLEIANPQPYLL
jgi:diguanylate cyclase (GGDEF)-like protein